MYANEIMNYIFCRETCSSMLNISSRSTGHSLPVTSAQNHNIYDDNGVCINKQLLSVLIKSFGIDVEFYC